jgi:hypothetical protein
VTCPDESHAKEIERDTYERVYHCDRHPRVEMVETTDNRKRENSEVAMLNEEAPVVTGLRRCVKCDGHVGFASPIDAELPRLHVDSFTCRFEIHINRQEARVTGDESPFSLATHRNDVRSVRVERRTDDSEFLSSGRADHRRRRSEN